MYQKGTAKLADINAELSALRQRMGLPQLPSASGAAASPAAIAVDQRLTQPRRADPHRTQQTESLTSAGGAFSSLLYSGTLETSLLDRISSRSFPLSSAPEIADGAGSSADPYVQKGDVLRYVRRQRQEFAETMSVIDDFTYDEDAERRKLGIPPPPVFNDPFVFVEVAATDAPPARVASTPHKPTSPPPAASPPSIARAAPGRLGSSVGSTAPTSSAALTERHGLRADLYSVDSALSRADAVKPASIRKANELNARNLTALQSQQQQQQASASAPVQTRSGKRLKQVVYREPGVTMRIVDRGLVRFCQACSHVVLGEGEGNCPHCGSFVSSTRGGGGHGGGSDVDVAAGDDKSARRATAGSYDGMTLAEIEAEEARQFREAVAAWRSAGADPPVAVATAAVDAKADVVAPLWERRTLYFTHLWNEMQRRTAH